MRPEGINLILKSRRVSWPKIFSMKGITLVVMCWAVANGGSHEQKTQSRRVYSSVAVNTSCSVFEVDRRYLSLSLSPKRVASATEVLDWSSTRMKVRQCNSTARLLVC